MSAPRPGTGPRWSRWVGPVLLLAIGVGIGGPVGALAAVVGLVIARWRGYRAVAATAFGVLGVAALLSVLEAPASGRAADYLFDFALDRPWASDLGLAAGVLALVAIVLAATAERAGSGSPPEGTGSGG